MLTNGYQLAIGIFKQSSSGTVYNKLPGEFASYKWDLSRSIIPTGYDYTNIQFGDATIETVERNSILSLTKAKKFDSGVMTPPLLTLATRTPAEEAMMIATLDSLTAADASDQFKVLVACGVYASTTTGVRTYNVFNAFCGIVTTDGGRQADAFGPFSGNLAIQSCHLPIIGQTACAATLSWTELTGAIAFTATGGSGSGS